MKKKIMSWFLLIKDLDVKRKAVNNHDPSFEAYEDSVNCIEFAIDIGFSWDDSPEGWDYWQGLKYDSETTTPKLMPDSCVHTKTQEEWDVVKDYYGQEEFAYWHVYESDSCIFIEYSKNLSYSDLKYAKNAEKYNILSYSQWINTILEKNTKIVTTTDKEESWTPKVGDWVVLRAPKCQTNWNSGMNRYVGKCVKLTKFTNISKGHYKIKEDDGWWSWEYSDRVKHFRKAIPEEIPTVSTGDDTNIKELPDVYTVVVNSNEQFKEVLKYLEKDTGEKVKGHHWEGYRDRGTDKVKYYVMKKNNHTWSYDSSNTYGEVMTYNEWYKLKNEMTLLPPMTPLKTYDMTGMMPVKTTYYKTEKTGLIKIYSPVKKESESKKSKFVKLNVKNNSKPIKIK
jgi:hypothetical protein